MNIEFNIFVAIIVTGIFLFIIGLFITNKADNARKRRRKS